MKEIQVIHGTGTDIIGEKYYTTTHEGIQKAVDYANTKGGGTVFVTKGIYRISSNYTSGYTSTENYSVILYSNITIKGEGRGTILKASGGLNDGSVLSCASDSSNNKYNITISNLCIQGSSLTNKTGIYLYNTGKSYTAGLTSGTYSRYDSSTVGKSYICKKGVTIENCIIEGCAISILLNACSNNNITFNTIQDNSNTGINLYSSGYNTNNNNITNNIIQNNNYGITFSSNGSDLNSNTISNNTIQNNREKGIYLSNSQSGIISNNIIQNNGSYGINLYSSCSKNVITKNIIQNNNQGGIHFDSGTCTQNIVCSNIGQNNYAINLEIAKGESNVVSSNIAQHASSSGVVINGYNNISNNNILNNNGSYGIYASGEGYILTGFISLNNLSSNVQINSSSYSYYIGS